MLKRLWQILGPVFCALVLVFLVLFFYPANQHSHSISAEKDDAVALTKTSFRSQTKKIRALSDPDHRFVAFFGSSEWLRMDNMHPSILAEAYDRNYIPYLLGQRGSASLSQYFGMLQLEAELTDKQAVYVISPQWFVKDGANPVAFRDFFSNDQLVRFLQKQMGSQYDQYAAKRLLHLNPDINMKGWVKEASKGKTLSDAEKQGMNLYQTYLQKEDAFFGQFLKGRSFQSNVAAQTKGLPKKFSYEELTKIATEDAKRSTNNNPFGIENSFYSIRVANRVDELKGSQKKFDYTKSPEFSDLQLVLQQFAKMRTNVIFVIPPVNSKWAEFTGLDLDMYQRSVAKIKFQLQSQGFNNIADLSRDGGKPYFMQDTIHIGWNGWLEFDRHVNPFLSNPTPAPTYQLDDQFLSKKWAMYEGKPEEFKMK